MRKNRQSLLLALATLLIAGLVLVGLAWFPGKAEPHRVTLTWQAPPTVNGVPVVGYNVYRRASEGGSSLRIATRVPGPPYEDRMVGSRRTYFYVVTSVDQLGRE